MFGIVKSKRQLCSLRADHFVSVHAARLYILLWYIKTTSFGVSFSRMHCWGPLEISGWSSVVIKYTQSINLSYNYNVIDRQSCCFLPDVEAERLGGLSIRDTTRADAVEEEGSTSVEGEYEDGELQEGEDSSNNQYRLLRYSAMLKLTALLATADRVCERAGRGR